jgi:hypothetical protein
LQALCCGVDALLTLLKFSLDLLLMLLPFSLDLLLARRAASRSSFGKPPRPCE